MSARSNGGQTWFRVPRNWDMDETLIGVTDTAKLLFLKIVEFCDSTGSSGELTVAQLLFLCRRYKRGREAADRLIASGALLRGSAEAELKQSRSTADAALTQSQRRAEALLKQSRSIAEAPLTQCLSIANAALWLPLSNTRPSIPPAQNKNRAPKETPSQPRAGAREGAREKTDRQTDREEERTPSGSVRSSSARAAPRVAGGATQPTQKDHETPDSAPANGTGTMSRAEAIAFARSEVARGRKNNPAATGIDTKFSKYDPNRPIEPIRSTFLFDEEPE
jgi:hypothetical protein